MKKLFIMFILMCEITIGAYAFRQVNELKIDKSWRRIGAECSIKLPKHVRLNQEKTTSTLEDFIKVGDKVTVKVQYVGLEQHTEFEGFVSKLKPNIPFEIECEDAVYFMKRTPIAKTWAKEENATLKSVVKYIVNEVNTKYPQAKLTLSSKLPDVNFTTEKGFTVEAGNNAATALEKIRESFGLASYLKGNELFTGLSYQLTYGRVKHSMGWNIKDEADLTYRKEEDTRIRIKPVGFRLDNTKVETKEIVGDKDGELRTVHYYNVTSEEQLLKLAKSDLVKYKYEGFEGKFETMLYPYCEPLMISELKGRVSFNKETSKYEYDEAMSGSYIIDSVITTFGVNGASREIEPGVKLSV